MYFTDWMSETSAFIIHIQNQTYSGKCQSQQKRSYTNCTGILHRIRDVEARYTLGYVLITWSIHNICNKRIIGDTSATTLVHLYNQGQRVSKLKPQGSWTDKQFILLGVQVEQTSNDFRMAGITSLQGVRILNWAPRVILLNVKFNLAPPQIYSKPQYKYTCIYYNITLLNVSPSYKYIARLSYWPIGFSWACKWLVHFVFVQELSAHIHECNLISQAAWL